MTVTVAAKARTLPERWTVHHDNRLRDTDGKYAAIAALSDEWGIESRVLLARLHRLRAGDTASIGAATGAAAPRVSAPQAESAARQDDPPDPPDLPGPPGPATQAVKGCVPPTMHRIVHALEARGRATYAELVAATGLSCDHLSVEKSQNRARLAAAGWRIASAGERPATFWLERVT